MLINYNSRPYDRYQVVSFYKAYNGIWEDYSGKKIDITGKTVIVGDYDESLGDTYRTPVSDANVTPGVEIVASEVSTLLGDNAVRMLDNDMALSLLLLLLIGSTLLFYITRSPIRGLLVLFLIVFAALFLDLYTFL